MKKTMLSLVTLLVVTSQAYAESGKFKIEPFQTEKSSNESILAGLSQLKLKNIDEAALISENFQNEIYAKMNAAIAQTGGQWPYTITTKAKMTGVIETTLRFPSLIQREGNHPANQVVARLYIPNGRGMCNYKFPSSIMLHYILNEVDKMEMGAQGLASGILNKAAAYAVIHMPHYGDRTSKDNFLTSDLVEFRKNTQQLILDVHMLKNLMASLPQIDPNRMNLSGISLGAVLGVTIGAIDQSFNSYTFFNGGANFSDILLNRVKNRPESEVALAMKGLTASDDTVATELAAIDGYTWMHRYKNKNIHTINASRDDIINYDVSVAPLTAGLKSANQLKTILNNDTHSPSGNAIDKFKIFKPLTEQIFLGGQTYDQACPRN